MASPHSSSALDDWNGRRVTVMGLGCHSGGVAVTRYLAERGAIVTVSDSAPAASLAASAAKLADLPGLHFHFGIHQEDDFRSAEVVVVNPAVRPDHPMLQVARESGARLTSEIEIFLRECPAPVIGVTGTSGKSTTASMIAAILQQAGMVHWLGGNIGVSLLGKLHEIAPTDWVVLELSSFQLTHLNAGTPMPVIAVVTNCAPNHLDWHQCYDDYRAAKQRLLREQKPVDVAVLNPDDSEVSFWASLAVGEVVRPLDDVDVPELRVPGEHNRQNARLAARAAQLAGAPPESIAMALRAFRGLPHRLEFVCEREGRRFWNDSKSTTPSATVAALAAMDGPAWLLAGGIGKGADFSRFTKTAARRTQGVALFGRDRGVLAQLLSDRGCENLCVAEYLDAAFTWCFEHSQDGDNILLSPGCASLDQFRDYAERGELFRKLANAQQ